MIYEYKKYKSLESFFSNTPKSNNYEKYTIIHKCKGLDLNENLTFNNNCFKCLFCICNPDMVAKFNSVTSNDNYLEKISKTIFKLTPIKSPSVDRGVNQPYKSLESFTAVAETSNIQPWAAGLLSCSCTKGCRVTMELPVFNDKYDRNGRLDIGVLANNIFIAIESKTSLDDALKDERFIEQHAKYTNEIKKYTNKYIYLTLIGGKETDLYPINNKYCTGNIGDKSKRFYEMIIQNNIKFISANALWGLYIKYIMDKNQVCEKIIYDIFSDKNCIGLVSAGKIMRKADSDIIIQEI